MSDLKKALLVNTGLTPPERQLSATNPGSAQSGAGGRMSINLASAPLGANERGLVVSVPIKLEAENSISMAGALDAQELRFSLLFWDRLDFPTSNVFEIGGGTEVEFLESANILRRSRAVSAGGEVASLMFESHMNTFRALDARDAGKWSVARGETSMGFRPDEVVADRGFVLELLQAIPVPNRDVPLDDILQFKLKRHAELIALRHHLENVYLQIGRSLDQDLAKALALEEIDKATSDLLKVGRESGMKLKLSGFDAKLDVLDLKAGSLAALGSFQMGLPLTAALLAGVVASVVPTVSLKSGLGLKKREKSATPFEYVSRFHRDLF